MSRAGTSSPVLPAEAWQRLRGWYVRHGRHHLPWRSRADPWGILVAETLLHRTRADAVAGLYSGLVERFPSPSAVALDPEGWLSATHGLGLRWRSEQFIEACRRIRDRHGGRVPEERQELMALPGLGHYVASAVRCLGFGRREALVDSNTIRLARRITGETADAGAHRTRAVQALVARLGPGGHAPDAGENFALLDLAALVCTPRDPRCCDCPVADWCASRTCDRDHDNNT